MKLFFTFFILLILLPNTSLFAQDELLKDKDLAKQKIYKSLEEALKTSDSVIVLDLGGQKLGKISPEIGKLKNLQKLILYDNKLKDLPTEITTLKNLQYLDLYNNQISQLPVAFENLQNLRYLDFGFNKFKRIPAEVYGLKKLRQLHFYGNRLKFLDNNIIQLENLEVLRLGQGLKFFFGGNRIKALPVNFGELQNLEELHLPNNRLRKLPPSFGQLSRLRWLNLYHNRFRKAPAEILELDSLENLYLWDRGFSKKEKSNLKNTFPETNINYQKDYEGNYWALQLGFQQGKYSVLDVGIARAFKKDFLLVALAASAEVNLNGKMSAAKLSLWANGITVFSTGLHAIYYFDEAQSSLALRPEIGLGLGVFHLNYGYNILFAKGTENINKHMVSLRMLLPLKY